MRAELLLASRMDPPPLGAPPQLDLLFGRAMMPDGLRLLQLPPCDLPAYAAARMRHALARSRSVEDAEVLEAARAYAACDECILPADMDRLVNMCARAGAASPRGLALGLVWVRSLDAALPAALPRPPHPFLREAVRAEASRIRRAVFG